MFVYGAEGGGAEGSRAKRAGAARPESVAIVGTFHALHAPIPLSPLTVFGEPSGYFAISLAVPRARVYTYKFIVDGAAVLDPIAPQVAPNDSGQVWSRFFTTGCRDRLSLNAWEFEIVRRLAEEILPFQTPEGRLALAREHDRCQQAGTVYRDPATEVTHHIDKLLAREACDRLLDYKLCLPLLHAILRQRHPAVPLSALPREAYGELYAQLARGEVPGWDYARYDNPAFFAELLHRHTCSRTFAPGGPARSNATVRAAIAT